MALKFHPDKFKDSSGEEVFKKISAAYKILIDPDKRRKYENGTGFKDIFSDGVNRRRPNQHFHHFGHGYSYYEQEFDPFDLFQQMFGGSMFHHHRTHRHRRTPRQNHHHHHHHRQQRNTQGNSQNAQSGIIILIVVWMVLIFIMGLGGVEKSEPLYSNRRNTKYTVKR